MTYQGQQGGHPQNNLNDIFSKADRQAIYQYRAKNAIDSVSSAPKFGAQMDYPGELVENVQSFAEHSDIGYNNGWNSTYIQAREEKNSEGDPKLDVVGFAYHHALGPLIDENAFYKEIMINQIMTQKTFGSDVPVSKGLFPAEMAFSETMIPMLVKAGYEWVIVSNSHISRACEGYPYSIHGDNNTPPNQADQVNPAQEDWFQMQVSRGCAPNNAYPYSFRPHYAKHVDPTDGKEYKIKVIPADQAMSWQDGYECYSTQDMEKIAPKGDPEHPILVLLAHDGDNAFGGGYSYYMQCVPNLVNAAVQQGFEPTTIETYLKDYPIDEDDVVHVEDGAWINASGDFGDPTFVNWNYPLFLADGSFSVTEGWSTKQRHYAIMTAIQNFVDSAEAASGGVDLGQVQAPGPNATPAEKAWHFYLPALNSGFEYYGMNILDMCLKGSLAGNEAIYWANQAMGDSWSDTTSPNIWRPYRMPYNPGGYQMGVLSKYQYVKQPTDFYVYTFIFDVSGLDTVKLYVRQDNDGVNPLSDNHNEVFNSHRDHVGDWVPVDMTERDFPKGNVYNYTGNNCFANMDGYLPDQIANQYYSQVKGYENVLLDYYIEAIDTKGNSKKSDIFHVYVGNNTTTDTEVDYEANFLSIS